MATLAEYIYPAKKNGLSAIKIRLSHNKDRKFFHCMDVEKKFIKDGVITSPKIKLQVQMAISAYKIKLLDLDPIIDSLTIDQVYNHVFGIDDNPIREESKLIDFIAFYREFMERKSANRSKRTIEMYGCGLKHLIEFIGCESLDINKINKKFLVEFIDWMRSNGTGSRAVEMYIGNMRTVHDAAKSKYNDEETGEILVKLSPFEHVEYKIPSSERATKKRAISVKAMQYIYELPDKPGCSRLNMARDAFILSYALCGMNAADMRVVDDLDNDGNLNYMRKKVVRRCGERCRIVIPINDIIKPLMKRYRGLSHLFVFGETYGTEGTFNAALNLGLKDMVQYAAEYYGKMWGVDHKEALKRLELPTDLTFYAARHTFATVARNRCGISISDIDRCLCHASNSVASTFYIDDDFTFVKDAVDKVLRVTFPMFYNR